MCSQVYKEKILNWLKEFERRNGSMGKRKMYRGISFLLAMSLLLTSLQIPVYAEDVNTDVGNVVLAESGEEGTCVVTTEAEFDAALADETVDIIEIGGEFQVGQTAGAPLVISRPLTIQGGTLSMRYLGIVLGADVTFKNIQLEFVSAESDAIVANGHTLILDNTTLISTAGDDWVISLFCGGINGYNYDNLPAVGANGTIIVKGNCSVGDIYAGNLTHMNAAEGAYNGDAVIQIENTGDNPAGTIGNIYGCGGRESMGEGTGNVIYPGTFNNPVTGSVEIHLYDNLVKQVIGYSDNTKIVYNGGAYLRSPILQNIASLTVESGKLQPAAESNFYGTAADVELAEDAQLYLDAIEDVTIGDFSGGGKLVLGQEQKLTVTGSVSGSTKVYTGGINYYLESEEEPIEAHTYIEAVQAQEENFVFQKDASYSGFLPLFTSDGVTGGSWITEQAYEAKVIVSAMEMEDLFYNPAEAVEAVTSLTMPIQVTCSESGVWGYLWETNPVFTVNDEIAVYDEDVYLYRTEGLAFWFDDDSDALIITDETGNAIPESGTYHFSITVPAENTEGQTQPMTVEATLTIVGEEEQEPIEPVKATVENWIGTTFTKDELDAYNAQFKLEPSAVTVKNNGSYGNETVEMALDDNWETTFWSASNNNNPENPTALEVNFGKTVEVGQIVYRVRQNASNKGFPSQFKIQISMQESGEDFYDAVEGSSDFTSDIIAIKFATQECVRLRFVWLEVASSEKHPSAAVFYCYKDDGIRPPEVTEARIEGWSVPAYTADERAVYDANYRLNPVNITSNRNHYGNSVTDNAIDNDWDNGHWEASVNASTSAGTYLEVAFDKLEEVGHIAYRVRQDYGTRGFPREFKIQISPQASGNYFVDVVHGTAKSTMDFIKISFDKVECRRLRFVWLDVDDTYPSASALYFYKEDNLSKEMDALFTDGAATALREGVTREEIADLKERIKEYPVPGAMMSYIEVAEMLIDGKQQTEKIHKPMMLTQHGNREKERERTNLTRQLSNYDLTGYYARPGDVLEVFVEADAESPMPRLVLASVGRNYGDWQATRMWAFGEDGVELKNGLNQIKVPENMKGCQVIYFYNPALSQEQAFAPTVRLCNGYKYPVYFYDSEDTMELAKAKETAFIQELTAYLENVVNNMDEAAKGNGEPNICEFVSEKILISTSAKAAFKNLDNPYIWKAGMYKEWAAENADNPKHAVIEEDENGEVTGIRFSGPAAIMQQYEWMYDDMMLYSGFNITDPTHEDYRNHGRFVFRPYTNGAGSAWAMHGYAGFNCGTLDMEHPMDDGWFHSITSGHAVLSGGWGEYHEIGHQLDDISIGYSEATNNLYPMNAQKLYCDATRLETDNNWYNLFTKYINTGVLPSGNVTFFPGYVIYQLDGVDFTGKSIYPEKEISNYGRASRYVRLHKEEIKHLPDILDRLVVSISMGCGVDLSEHFEYYGRTVSAEAKTMLAGLPKEERPTWLVNERTFAGGAFDEADKEKVPVIASIAADAATGAVNIVVGSETFTEENVQCFSIYRQQKIGEELIGEPEWIGVTADDLSTKDVNELYHFTDKNVAPGLTYVYSVGVYDCKLIENEKKASAEITIGEEIEVSIEQIVINNGDAAASFEVGQEYKVKVNYYPTNASVNLNEIRWWADGYSEDTNRDGAGKHIITISPDPDYPNDPTRRVLKGIQWGKTELYVSIGDKSCKQKINVNRTLEFNDSDTVTYKFAFNNTRDTFMKGEVYELGLYRTTCDGDGNPTSEVIKVMTTPGGTSWEISDPEVLSVDGHGFITAKQAGSAIVSFKRGEETVAQCELTVVEEEVPLTKVSLNGFSEEELEAGITMNVGEVGKLSYTLAPVNTTQNGTPVFMSSNASVVRVDQDGNYTAVAGGSAELTVRIGNQDSETLKITVNDYVPVRNITLNTNVVTLNGEGSKQTLQATAYPANATVAAGNMVWTSDNEEVFTVENGVVTAVGTGTATLTVSLEGKSATAKVTVTGADTIITGIKFSGYAVEEDISLTLKQGKTHQLAVVVEPKEAASFGTITWSSSDESVATVEYGYITALAVGQTTITATVTQNETSYQLTCNLIVEKNDILLEGWGIEQKIVSLGGNESLQLQVYPRPGNANIDAQGNKLAALEWTSDNSEIVSVDDAGVITGRKTGTATITASGNGFSVSCRVTVDDSNLAEKISLDKESLTLELGKDQEAQLNCNILPETVTASPVWKSSIPSVAEVNQDGKITVHKEGITIITVSIGEQSASCEVTVLGEEREVCFDSNGGEAVASQTLRGGTRVQKPVDPEKTGYNFFGWYLVDEQGTMADTPYDFAKEVVTEDITLKAKWQVKAPTANYPSGSEVYKNTAIELNSATGDIYYTLDGTVPTKESTKYDAPIVVTAPTTVKAIAVEEGYENSEVATFEYNIRKLTVTFNAGDGVEVIPTQILDEGEKATDPGALTRDEYLFRGWYLTDEQGVLADSEYDFTTPVMKDIVLTAKWEVLQINGYSQVTSADLDPEKEYIIVAVDSDNDVYGLYGNSNGLEVGPGALDSKKEGAVTAVLENLDSKPTATYLQNEEPIKFEQLHIKVVENKETGKYKFYFSDTGYYLKLDDKMFSSGDGPELKVSMIGKSYKIVNDTKSGESNQRMLDLNVNGDKKSGKYKDYITDFWGPRPTSDPVFRIYLFEKIEEDLFGHSLSLEGTVGVNFYMQLGKEVLEDDGAYMRFTLNGKEYMEVSVKEATTVEKDGTTCHVFKCGVPVKDMETKITAQLILSDGRKGCVYSYTVKEYIDSIKNDEEYIDERELVNAMSNFGNQATKYFANDTVDKVENVTPEELKSYETHQAQLSGNENRVYYGSSLLLKTDTILRHYFTEKVTVVGGGYEAIPKGNLWYIEFEGIPAHELGNPKTITVTTKAGTDITLTYSPLSYAYITLSREGEADSLTSLMRAMYQYHKAAQAYLAEKTNN